MKNATKEILGFNVQVVGIADSIGEAVQLAGSEDAVLTDYNNYVLFHSHYAILRRKIVETLEKATGIKRQGEGEGEKFKVTEKDAEYIARLETELGEEELKKFETEVSSACEAIKVDYSPSTRGAGGSATPAKKWLAYYDELKKEEKLDAFCSKFGIDTSGMDEETLKITVANKVKDVVTAQMKEAAKNALSV